MRKYYLDNIRWTVVLLVLVYHVCFLFNGLGIAGGIPSAANLPIFDLAASLVYPWFMVLLFVVSGISSRYSLEKRGGKKFLKERAVKLLVPSTLGLFVLHWTSGYLNIKLGGGLDYIPGFLVYPISAVSGIGPLWFIQLLFLFSCLLLLLRKLDQSDRLWKLCGKADLSVLLLLVLPIFAASQILNMPVLTPYRFGIYFTAFLTGYFVFSHDRVQETLKSAWLPLLLAAAAGAFVYGMVYRGRDYSSLSCLKSPVTVLYLWLAVLAVLGTFQKYFDRETPVTRYLTASSFGLYLLHYPILLWTCYGLTAYFNLPVFANYLLALLAELVFTFLAYGLFKRIPLLRFFLLGIQKKKRQKISPRQL